MATVKVVQPHTLTHDDARERVTALFETFKSQYGIGHRWEGDVLHLNGTGFDGRAVVGPGSVEVEVRLGFAIALLKGQVEASIRTELEKQLTAA